LLKRLPSEKPVASEWFVMLEKMPKNDLISLIEFFKRSGKLKKVSRSGWMRVGIKSPESVADHTFRTALLCMIFSSLEGLDELKMLQMALIHDLPEVIVGDLTPSEKIKSDKNSEEDAMRSLLALLPKEVRGKCIKVWHEYTTSETDEAKAVRQLEKLEMALQAREYEESGATRENLEAFVKSAEESIRFPAIRALFHAFRPQGKG
jgi:putative hydrolase of HD superfamily